MPIQKLSAQNNGWTKKEVKIFRRNSVIPEYYIGWIGIGNCGQKTSSRYTVQGLYLYNAIDVEVRYLQDKVFLFAWSDGPC